MFELQFYSEVYYVLLGCTSSNPRTSKIQETMSRDGDPKMAISIGICRIEGPDLVLLATWVGCLAARAGPGAGYLGWLLGCPCKAWCWLLGLATWVGYLGARAGSGAGYLLYLDARKACAAAGYLMLHPI